MIVSTIEESSGSGPVAAAEPIEIHSAEDLQLRATLAEVEPQLARWWSHDGPHGRA
ncbi:hypothetical protein [Botrimarina hoheduenensis]|uniref:Uncharacterized protein n=1 Tax=Botrimarina hoheduenensis TaxID=2528000 RepID=A0A5C5WBV3_9BACT|nr:hypothetical protein [Botrimarina hoheduenensis]TWT48396.1 hypothetical protein Pla111_01620 [Botrimarina hoheduenensis]